MLGPYRARYCCADLLLWGASDRSATKIVHEYVKDLVAKAGNTMVEWVESESCNK
jgi:hypothetical protein